jgi:hypothetical protein
MSDREERTSLALFASGSALRAFTYTNSGPFNSVIGWVNPGGDWPYYNGAATSVGYLLLAIGVWRLRRCDWGSELGFVMVGVGILAGGLAGIVQITYQALWVNGLIGSALFRQYQVIETVTACSWVALASGAMLSWRPVAADGDRERWSTPWGWCSAGSALIAIGYVTLACLTWLSVGDLWVADAIYGSQTAGWLLLALAVYRFGTVIEAPSVSWERAALSAATIAAASFATGTIVYIVILNRPEAFITLLRWFTVPLFAGWVSVGVAALFMSVPRHQRREVLDSVSTATG